jgi:KaiC/GvpD/RAD55 family RecA-like ATPase
MIDIVDTTTLQDLQNLEKDTLHEVLNKFSEILEGGGYKRVVVDSITSICDILESEGRFPLRNFIFQLKQRLKRGGKKTVILLSEVSPQVVAYSKYGMEEFIADGIIMLSDMDRQGELLRTIQVVKMRGINHSRTRHSLIIKEDGITVSTMFKGEV